MSKTFEELGVSPGILSALTAKGYSEATPVQEQVIPKLLEGTGDLVGLARTGTGKTAAFGIPIVQLCEESVSHVQALVLTPTRELALQVSTEIESMAAGKRLNVVPIYGGAPIVKQSKALSGRAHIVVGTPGRILDHVRRKRLKLAQIRFLILDEADEMLDMGFQEDLEKILETANPERQTLLFSATFSPEMQRISKNYLNDAQVIQVKQTKEEKSKVELLAHEVHVKDKPEALHRVIDAADSFYGVVFCRRKTDVDHLVHYLQKHGVEADGLHGDMSQSSREKTLSAFRESRVKVLVATDVAARGIDINNLNYVVNYAVPDTKEAFVHRIGRTARAGKSGTVVTLISPSEFALLRRIEDSANLKHTRIKLPSGADIISKRKKNIQSDIFHLLSQEVPDEYSELAENLLQHSTPEIAVSTLLYKLFGDSLNPANYRNIETLKARGPSGGGGGKKSYRPQRGGGRPPQRSGGGGKRRK